MTGKSSDARPGEPEANPVLLELGRRLLRARLRYGERMDPPRSVSQAAIARELGVTGVTVGAWEAGKNDPGMPMLYRLAELYRVRVVWLLAGEGEMHPEAHNRPALAAPTPPMDAFRPISTGDDLRAALGEPRAKKRRGGDAS